MDLLCRRQRSDETVSSFLAELRALAKHTSLARFTFEEKNAEDYIIDALLALGSKSSAIQQRLLREDNITLQNFYNIAVTAETVEADQQLLQEGKVDVIKKRSRQPSSNQVRHSSTRSPFADGHSAVAVLHLPFACAAAVQDAIQTTANVQHLRADATIAANLVTSRAFVNHQR